MYIAGNVVVPIVDTQGMRYGIIDVLGRNALLLQSVVVLVRLGERINLRL